MNSTQQCCFERLFMFRSIQYFTFFILLISIGLTPLCAEEPRVVGDTLVFALPDLDGKLVSSLDARFRNKVVFVTIWGTWCPPCLSEIPTFIDLQNKYQEDGLVIMGIAFERDTLADARQKHLWDFLLKRQINQSLVHCNRIHSKLIRPF